MTLNELFRRVLFLPEQASTFARDVDFLHYVIISTAMFMATLIFGLTGFFLIRYRRRSDSQTTRKVQTSLAWEVVFVGAPLSVFLAWFFIGYHDFVHMRTPPTDAMDVYVVGKQWMWKFTHAEGPNAVGVLRVPVGRPVRLLLTSQDVIHSFYVPAFRVKQDALPGAYTQAWFEVTRPGRYRVMCAEYCGLKHSEMWAEVVALSPEDYAAWLREQREGPMEKRDATPSVAERKTPQEPALQAVRYSAEAPHGELMVAERGSLIERGERVAAEQGCLRCHSVDGTAHIGPTWRGLYRKQERLVGGTTVVADEAYLTESMMQPLEQVVEGFEPVMPSYQGRLEAAEVAALLEYIKSLRGSPRRFIQTGGPVYEPIGAQ
ncbi:cytochrome c oxidase subunit II [Melittangium boletus]|uniref:cytochrome-c oxidase n=1 Tax=Melittangium boletus DSM 14713 TaxID=1294270 RepID=A0A250IEY9_9BACT|nr:cytochrome c oxidase subunit II [Melittangium boletus]ATB29790.1 cytochrome c oxidase subunit II [Melittangium boletus DSM 14713]